MSVRVRLTRVGSKKNPLWRVVVADQRSPRDGRIIESIGHYNPQTQPSTIVIDRDRLDHWIEQGAQPTNTIRKLMRAPNSEPRMAQPAQGADQAATTGPAEAAGAEAEATDPADAEPETAQPAPAEPEADEPEAAASEAAIEGDPAGETGEPDQPEG